MQGAFCKIWPSVMGIAVAAGMAGCGGSSAPDADPAVAFTQYTKAARPFDCSSAYVAMGNAFEKGDYGALRDSARKHRDVIETFDAELGAIAFPSAVRPIVDKMGKFNATELTALYDLAGVDVKDTDRMDTLTYQVEVADSSVTVHSDALRAVLGHPVSQAGIAADQLDLAYLTFYQDSDPAAAKFKAALAADDLDGAKAANAIQEDAAQAYIDRLGTIDWPSGFEAQVSALRDNLRALIEFDRHQVEVATVAQIAPASAEDSRPLTDADRAEGAMWTALAKASQQSDPQTKC